MHRFIEVEPTLSRYREGTGSGYAHYWLDTTRRRVSVRENYVIIPYRRQVFVFVTADESDVAEDGREDDCD